MIIGHFWAWVGVILLFLCFFRNIVKWFYGKFIRGLSRRNNKKLIEKVFWFNRLMEDFHSTFATLGFLSVISHIYIMKFKVRFLFLGFIGFLLLICIISLGVIDRYVYKDKNGDNKGCHIIMAIIFFIIVIIHGITV